MAASSTKALVGAITADLLIAATKFVIGAIGGSSAIVVEGVHSVVDAGNAGLMLFGRRRSRRPPDDMHPFGYGMELYFWSFVVAMVVFVGGGIASAYEGIDALVHPRPFRAFWPNYLVIGAAAVFESVSLYIGVREFKKYRSEARFEGSWLDVVRASKNPAMFLTVLEDSAALAGLGVALVGVALTEIFRQPIFDGAASLGIGLVLMAEAMLLGRECRGLITGERARPVLEDAVRDVLARHHELGPVEDLRTLQLGPDKVLLLLRVRYPRQMTAGELERAVRELEEELARTTPSVEHVAFDVTPDQIAREPYHRS